MSLPGDFWVDELVELMMGEVVVASVRGLVEMVFPVAGTVLVGIDDVVFDWGWTE